MTDKNWELVLNEYIRQGEPDKVDRITNWKQIQEYQYYLAMAEEIKSVLENY